MGAGTAAARPKKRTTADVYILIVGYRELVVDFLFPSFWLVDLGKFSGGFRNECLVIMMNE